MSENGPHAQAISFLPAVSILLAGVVILLPPLFTDRLWVHETIHSSLEAMGALTAIFLAILIFLLSGFLFSLVWLPDREQPFPGAKALPFLVFFASLEHKVAERTIELAQAREAQEETIRKLHIALEKVKLLSGFLSICSSCKKIRDERGYWNQIEAYISRHSEAEFSHCICPSCAEKLYPELDLYDKKRQIGGRGEVGTVEPTATFSRTEYHLDEFYNNILTLSSNASHCGAFFFSWRSAPPAGTICKRGTLLVFT